jgi:hypothetical protein
MIASLKALAGLLIQIPARKLLAIAHGCWRWTDFLVRLTRRGADATLQIGIGRYGYATRCLRIGSGLLRTATTSEGNQNKWHSKQEFFHGRSPIGHWDQKGSDKMNQGDILRQEGASSVLRAAKAVPSVGLYRH